jgi:glutathione S-transferase
MTAVLYATPASHPCLVVERALQLKGMEYRRVDLIPVAHRLVQQARFGARTVPGVEFGDGARVAGSRTILRELDARIAEPALLPSGEDARARVERAEEWGDEVLQPLVRRVVWAAVSRAPAAIDGYTEGADLPLPRPVARAMGPLVARLARRVNGASDPVVRADLIGLRTTHLDRVDRWIADGTLGGAGPNAADLQIGAALRLLATVEDMAPLLEGRPADALARRWFPELPGAVPAGTLPSAWVATPANGGH